MYGWKTGKLVGDWRLRRTDGLHARLFVGSYNYFRDLSAGTMLCILGHVDGATGVVETRELTRDAGEFRGERAKADELPRRRCGYTGGNLCHLHSNGITSVHYLDFHCL